MECAVVLIRTRYLQSKLEGLAGRHIPRIERCRSTGDGCRGYGMRDVVIVRPQYRVVHADYHRYGRRREIEILIGSNPSRHEHENIYRSSTATSASRPPPRSWAQTLLHFFFLWRL